MAEGLEETETETKEERAERKRVNKVYIRSKKVGKLLKPMTDDESTVTSEIQNKEEEAGNET